MMSLTCLPNQRENEKVVLFLRRNWLTVFGLVLIFSMMFIVPLAIAAFFHELVARWLAHPILGPILTLVAGIYAMSIWLFAFLEFTDYYLDTWIVTNERVLSSEQKGLFNRVSSELHLAAIQDVTSELRGMIGTFLDFGDVQVQTAAEKERFQFDNVNHPDRVKETIIQLVEEDKKRHAGTIVAEIARGQTTMEEGA